MDDYWNPYSVSKHKLGYIENLATEYMPPSEILNLIAEVDRFKERLLDIAKQKSEPNNIL